MAASIATEIRSILGRKEFYGYKINLATFMPNTKKYSVVIEVRVNNNTVIIHAAEKSLLETAESLHSQYLSITTVSAVLGLTDNLTRYFIK